MDTCIPIIIDNLGIRINSSSLNANKTQRPLQLRDVRLHKRHLLFPPITAATLASSGLISVAVTPLTRTGKSLSDSRNEHPQTNVFVRFTVVMRRFFSACSIFTHKPLFLLKYHSMK